jgi:hypothetical protein
MHQSVRASLALLVCLLLLIQSAAGAAMMLCQHETSPAQVVADTGSGDCPGHAEAGQVGTDASAPLAAAYAHAADADDAGPGCDCQLCLMVPQGVLPADTLSSPARLAAVLHASAMPALASIPALPLLKPPRHPA